MNSTDEHDRREIKDSITGPASVIFSNPSNKPFHSYDWTNCCPVCGWHVKNDAGKCAWCRTSIPFKNFLKNATND